MKRHENARTQHEERHERDEKVARVGDGAEGRPSQRTGHGLFGRFLTVLHLRDRKGRGAEGGTAVPALRLRGPWRKGPDVELWEPKLLTSEIREEEAGMRNLFGSDSEEYAERTGRLFPRTRRQ
jgi:hypothetical protein